MHLVVKRVLVVVEALVNNRIGIGTDINEIAVLLAKVKTTPVTRSVLVDAFAEIMDKASPELNGATLLNGCCAHNKQLGVQEIRLPDRVDYWFKPHIKSALLALLQAILSADGLTIIAWDSYTYIKGVVQCINFNALIKKTLLFNYKRGSSKAKVGTKDSLLMWCKFHQCIKDVPTNVV